MDVMLVDDEILAIEHIKKLIDWEVEGFRITAEATNPVKAIELFKQAMPQLVFADIKMPGMDGITFSREILKLNPHVKIVLLTSYKEFKYAQAALEIGAINYFLKHEINADSLLSELRKIKTNWVREHRRNTMMRRKLLQEALLGQLREDEQVELQTSFQVGDDAQFTLFLAKPLERFLLLSNKQSSIPQADVPIELGEMVLLEMLPMSANMFVMLASMPRGLSEQARRSLQQTELTIIQKALETQLDHSVNVIASQAFSELTMLPSIYEKAKFVLQQTLFEGKHRNLLAEDSSVPDSLPQQSYHVFLDASIQHLQSRHYEPMLTALKQCFDTVLQSADFTALDDVRHRWLRELDKVRESHALPIVEVLIKKGAVLASGHSAFELRDMVMEITKQSMQQFKYGQVLSKRIEQAINFIEEHYALEITAEHIAESVNLSGDHLRHLFREEVGLTVLDYLTQVRINHAKRLLAQRKFRIYEIAEMVGYGSGQYFSQVFRKVTGMTPNNYVERLGDDVIEV